MKRYIKSAVKNVYKGHTRERIEYTSGQELLDMLYDAGVINVGGNFPDNACIFSEDVNFVSGPVTIEVWTGDNSHWSRTFKIIKDGEEVYNCSTSQLRNNVKVIDRIASAAESTFKRAIDPEYQQKQKNKQILKNRKEMSIDDLYEYVHTYGIDREVAIRALRSFRYKVTDEDWLHLYSWELEELSNDVENWASLSQQAYGYSTIYVIQLDTGINTYQTEVYDSEGWHTE